jgi:hypothetical protein
MLLYDKDFGTRIANEKKNLKGRQPKEGYSSKNKQLFSCSLLQQLLNKEMFDIGATRKPKIKTDF